MLRLTSWFTLVLRLQKGEGAGSGAVLKRQADQIALVDLRPGLTADPESALYRIEA